MTQIGTILIDGEECTIHEGTYVRADGPLAILIKDEIGAPFTKLTVNIDGYSEHLPADHFVAKTEGENEPYLDLFRAHPLFTPSGRTIVSGFHTYEIWRLNRGAIP